MYLKNSNPHSIFVQDHSYKASNRLLDPLFMSRINGGQKRDQEVHSKYLTKESLSNKC